MMPQMGQPPQDLSKVVTQIKELISKKSYGIIMLPAKSTQDAVAAGASLYLALLKLGKNITISASVSPKSDLVGADKVSTEFDSGGSNLVISFPYQEGTIDKIDYNIQGDKFNMIIVPIDGQNKIQPDQVQYTYTGGKADFIFTIDAPSLNALGEIYTKNQQKFDSSTIINIDRHMINGNYGMLNLVSKSTSSTSELVLKLLQEMKVEMDRDIATNLYAGIAAATNNFTAYSVTADTFEAVAILLRAGAVKKPYILANQPSRSMGGLSQMRNPDMGQFGGGQFGGGQFGAGQPFNAGFDNQSSFGQSYPSAPTQSAQPNYAPQRTSMPRSNPAPAPVNQSFEKQSKKIDQVEKTAGVKENIAGTDDSPENFLKPKIFSESGLV